MNILSIQSQVVYGHVGNSAAVLPLQRLGLEVWPVPTVLFSNHPGHGGFRGKPTDPALITELVAGLEQRGFLGKCDAALTGYLRTSAIGETTLAAVGRVRQNNPGALWCCDPVFGDSDTGLYVDADLPPVLAGAVAMADIFTPNAFELATLSGRRVESRDDALAASQTLRNGMRTEGPRLVICTSILDAGGLATLMLCDEGAFSVTVPMFEGAPRGAGDLLAALFLGRFLLSRNPVEALRLAISGVHAALAASAAAGSNELQVVATQDEIVAPDRIFEVHRID